MLQNRVFDRNYERKGSHIDCGGVNPMGTKCPNYSVPPEVGKLKTVWELVSGLGILTLAPSLLINNNLVAELLLSVSVGQDRTEYS